MSKLIAFGIGVLGTLGIIVAVDKDFRTKWANKASHCYTSIADKFRARFQKKQPA